jgi:hypothetical protein
MRTIKVSLNRITKLVEKSKIKNMKKRIQSFYAIIFIVIISMSCNNSDNQSQPSKIVSDTTPSEINNIDTIKNEEPIKIEKKLNVGFKTKLVEWGGDGKWHDMYKNGNGSYSVNYADPFKIILTGYYTDLLINIKSSNGLTIFEKSNVEIPEKGEYIITNDKMIGENETNFYLEIKEKDKIIFKGNIESVPGGE